jgi:hypothetical protein
MRARAGATALLRYCATALLRYCATALLRYRARGSRLTAAREVGKDHIEVCAHIAGKLIAEFGGFDIPCALQVSCTQYRMESSCMVKCLRPASVR